MTLRSSDLFTLTLHAATLLGATHGRRGKSQNPYAKASGQETAEGTAYRRRMSKAYQAGYRKARRRTRNIVH